MMKGYNTFNMFQPFRPVFIILLLFSTSCFFQQGNKPESEVHYFYEITGEKGEAYRYQLNKIKTTTKADSTIRKITFIRFKSDYKPIDTATTKEVINGKIVWRRYTRADGDGFFFTPYLNSTKEDTCVSYLFKTGFAGKFSYRHCYLGRESIFVGDKAYENVYVFSKEAGVESSHSVETRLYYDIDFNLLKEEYVKGHAPYFKIERLDSLPKELLEN